MRRGDRAAAVAAALLGHPAPPFIVGDAAGVPNESEEGGIRGSSRSDNRRSGSGVPHGGIHRRHIRLTRRRAHIRGRLRPQSRCRRHRRFRCQMRARLARAVAGRPRIGVGIVIVEDAPDECAIGSVVAAAAGHRLELFVLSAYARLMGQRGGGVRGHGGGAEP